VELISDNCCSRISSKPWVAVIHGLSMQGEPL
jgi:hypothetical protein